tara:strand:+ start:2859 stop:4184 length:1326 start_codon:yes stop_codon:yes gene_type:complete
MKPNIFLLTIDSIRADRFSGPKKTAVTPNFDFIIENGLFFEQNISSCDQTGTSLASIFTGKYPMNSGVTQFNFNFEFSTFFDHLKNLGYSLYSCVSDLSIFEKITENFDRNSRFIYGGTTTYPHLDNDIGDEIVNDFLNKKMNEPWMFYSHLMDLKDPTVWAKEYDDIKFGKTVYDRNLSALDKWIGKFLEKIDLTNTLFIITTDHGEYVLPQSNDIEKSIRKVSGIGKKSQILGSVGKKPFALSLKIAKKIKQNKVENLDESIKRNYYLSRASTELYDDLIRVPLLFIGHGIKEPKKISKQTRHIDIFPTIFELIEEKVSDSSIDGRSNVPLIKDQKMDDLPVYIETGSKSPREIGKVVGIRTSNYKYFRSRDNPKNGVNLYDLKNDPNEENNIQDEILIKKMEDILLEILNKSKSSVKKEITDDEAQKLEEELRKMGYI